MVQEEARAHVAGVFYTVPNEDIASARYVRVVKLPSKR